MARGDTSHGSSGKLNTTPNPDGFKIRYNNGLIAGNNMVNDIKSGNIITNKNAGGTITDTLDIVCHSMGYAYALGMIEAIKQSNLKIPFGRFYIIAPEGAGNGTVPTGFTEVWQYGTDEKNESLDKQDGIAPQVRCGNLLEAQRAFIPNDGSVPRGFISSHMIINYNWIFNITDPKKNGYVKPR